MSDQTVYDRLARAQAQEMEANIVAVDPLVVTVTNHDSETVHTVVPEAIHCSGEDHTYRGTFCKHLLFLLMQDGEIGEVLREAVIGNRADLEAQVEQTLEMVGEQLDLIEQYDQALDATGVEPDEDEIADLNQLDGLSDGPAKILEPLHEDEAGSVATDTGDDDSDWEQVPGQQVTERDEFSEMVEGAIGEGDD